MLGKHHDVVSGEEPGAQVDKDISVEGHSMHPQLADQLRAIITFDNLGPKKHQRETLLEALRWVRLLQSHVVPEYKLDGDAQGFHKELLDPD